MAEHNGSVVTVNTNSNVQTKPETISDGPADEQSVKVCVPTTVAESTLDAVPHHLERLIAQMTDCGGSDKNKHHLTFAVCYALMVESGFVPSHLSDACDIYSVDFHRERLDKYVRLLENWKNEEVEYMFAEFVLQPFPDHCCRMVLIPFYGTVNVNVSVDGHLVRVHSLNASKYVVSEKSKNLPKKFRNLDEMSIEFKDHVANVAKMAILSDEGVLCACLHDLPYEILYAIFLQLDATDFMSLSCTCKRFRNARSFYKETVWKYYLQRDYSCVAAEENKKTNPDWFSRYRQAHIKMLEARRPVTRRSRILTRSVSYLN